MGAFDPIAVSAPLLQSSVMSITIAMIAGGIFGVIVGLTARSSKLGCVALFIVPIAHYAYMTWWQSTHVENLRSTSGLDILFLLPLTCVGAMVGFLVGIAIKHAAQQRRNGS